MSSVAKSKAGAVKLARTFDEIDENELSNADTRTSDTMKAYENIIRKLKEFLKVSDDDDIPKVLLTDKNYALFSHEFGIACHYHPSQYKKMNGALNWLNSKFELTNYFDFPHLWPLVTRASPHS